VLNRVIAVHPAFIYTFQFRINPVQLLPDSLRSSDRNIDFSGILRLRYVLKRVAQHNNCELYTNSIEETQYLTLSAQTG
jgi:hypothetical protein